MAEDAKTKVEQSDLSNDIDPEPEDEANTTQGQTKSHPVDKESPSSISAKRRCVSSACIACRRRKSKCDGNTPSCAACSSVYNTTCVYDPNSDHRRKGVYKKDIDNLKTRNSTLQTLIQAILNYPEHEVPQLVKQIRTCESLDDVAETIIARNNALAEDDESEEETLDEPSGVPMFEKELSGKIGKLRLNDGAISFIGGTSNLIFMGSTPESDDNAYLADEVVQYTSDQEPIASWTDVTSDVRLIIHLMNMYFTWHYSYFTTVSRSLFWRDFKQGKPSQEKRRKTVYCTPLLVNAMLALGCHFTSWPQARVNPSDSATAGDHFFAEAKRLILENDEYEKPRLPTVQALALMSVREAGCGREARGWVYSGMSFRMAYDLGLNLESGNSDLDETEIDARRMTIWGCFLFDKCWSNYLGRQPQLPLSNITTPKFEVFPVEEAEIWMPHTDSGADQHHMQPSRTRAIALQISLLCEISGDLLLYFYSPHHLDKPPGKQAELKKLSELHTRLEAWRKNLPKEMEPREGSLPNILLMHMFFQLLYIHLFRPFLKYKPGNSPLPAHVSPRKFLIHAAAAISKLLRIYRRTYGLRQICNIAVYISHMACTVHVLNLPDKLAARDLAYGLSHLEEIAESWLCARRTLGILQQVSRRWNVDLPEQALKTFEKAEAKFGPLQPPDQINSPKASTQTPLPATPIQPLPPPVSVANVAAHPNQSLQHPISNGNYIANTVPLDTTPPPIVRHLDGTLSLPPRHSDEFSRISNQHQYVLPQTYHQNGQRNRASNTSQRPNGQWRNGANGASAQDDQQSDPLTSPTMLFGGVDGLIQDQEWWLRDSHQMFATWNHSEQDAENVEMGDSDLFDLSSNISLPTEAGPGGKFNMNGTRKGQPPPQRQRQQQNGYLNGASAHPSSSGFDQMSSGYGFGGMDDYDI